MDPHHPKPNREMLAGLLAPLLGIPAVSATQDGDAWRTLAARAERERLMPLLYAAVQQTGRCDIPPDVLATLAEAHCRSAAAMLYQQQELAALLCHCAAAQTPCIVLKGSAPAATLYLDPALRPCGDIDLLFRPKDIPVVLQLLQRRGFATPTAADLQAAAGRHYRRISSDAAWRLAGHCRASLAADQQSLLCAAAVRGLLLATDGARRHRRCASAGTYAHRATASSGNASLSAPRRRPPVVAVRPASPMAQEQQPWDLGDFGRQAQRLGRVALRAAGNRGCSCVVESAGGSTRRDGAGVCAPRPD